MTYTREDWSRGVLAGIGNLSPDIHIVHWIVSWTVFETAGPGSAQYNLLNTTEQNTPGVVSNYNSAGVKNYDSFAHGVQANAKVLQNGYYPTILHGLKTNNMSTLAFWNDIDRELSIWGTGSHARDIFYLIGHMGDVFTGNDTSVIDTAWTKFIPDLSSGTGIYTAWLNNKDVVGSPLSKEMELIAPNEVVEQEFEHGTAFWIGGNAHWRVYK